MPKVGYLVWRDESTVEPYNNDPRYGLHLVHRNVDLYWAFTLHAAEHYQTQEDGTIISERYYGESN